MFETLENFVLNSRKDFSVSFDYRWHCYLRISPKCQIQIYKQETGGKETYKQETGGKETAFGRPTWALVLEQGTEGGHRHCRAIWM